MLREEAPGAPKRGSPLLWMEGEQGEDRRPGAGGAGRRRSQRPGTRRLRRRPAWARVFPAPSAGPGRRRPPRAHPSLCLLLAREPRFRGAFSWPPLQGRVLASCSHLPLSAQPRPLVASGHLGSSPASLLALVWAALPAWEPGEGGQPPGLRAGPARALQPPAIPPPGRGDPPGRVGRRPPAPRAPGCQGLTLPLLGGGPGRTAGRGPWTPRRPLHPVGSQVCVGGGLWVLADS